MSFNIERLNGGKPILTRVSENPWESKVVFNPGCVLVSDSEEIGRIIEAMKPDKETYEKMKSCDSLCFLAYRAQGAGDYRRSSIGLAIFTPQLELIKRFSEPILKPEKPFENLGVEDPRITKFDGKYFMFYTGYATGVGRNKINICVAFSDDLIHWEKIGLLKGRINEVDNKNAVLFPERVNNKLVLLHRPMEGEDAMKIHIAISEEINGIWEDIGVLLDVTPSDEFERRWNGAGAPPLKISEDKFLLIYHIGNMRKDGSKEYDLGIAVVGKSGQNFVKVLKRFEPFMRPETEFETIGDEELGVNNVVFICGAYFYGDYLYLPYAGADSVVLGSRVRKDEIIGWASSL